MLGGIGTAGRSAADGSNVRDEDRTSVRAVSYNVRFDTPEDEYSWDERFGRVVEIIRELDPDLLGIQEAMPNQYDDLREELDEFSWHAAGRKDGDREGEMVPIAWRRDRFEALDTGEFWLSETPDEPGSIGWDADLPRVTMWTRLRDREADEKLWYYNTHFDHIGERARLESARILRERAGEYVPNGRPVVVTGDFNASPFSEPYCAVVEDAETDDPPLVDARRVADDVSGPEGTSHEFSPDLQDRVDYVFVLKSVPVREYRAIPDQVGAYRSDHLPLLTVLDPWT